LPVGKESDITHALSKNPNEILEEMCNLYEVDRVALMKIIQDYPTPEEL